MREFLYFSKNGVTAGNLIKDNLMKAGRIDIACQFIIQSFFVSRHLREDVKVHLILNGPPDFPKHLELFPGKNLEGIEDKIDISKKDVAGLIKRMLYKYKKGQKISVAEGYDIEKKSFVKVLEELSENGKEIYILDKRGEDIRDIDFGGDSLFIIGDHDGIPKQELKRVKHLNLKKISVGPHMLFASQVVTLIHNEIDRKL
jgi:tRNA (pseudouridine54-N1)-methyltransferase|tara:strand:- start:142 stop:744 length:603 start_codon:yes stop_codon:yes gene_type:complete